MLLEEKAENTPDERSDEEVLAASLKRPGQFAVLVDRYEQAFLRKAKGVLHDKEAAEDVVQETFTKIYMHGGRFTEVDGARFSSWAYKILMNTSFTRYRKRKRKWANTTSLDPEVYETLPDLTDYEEQHMINDQVASLLSQIPTGMSRILELRFLKGKTNSEIAVEEGTTEGAIKTRVYRAKQALKDVQMIL